MLPPIYSLNATVDNIKVNCHHADMVNYTWILHGYCNSCPDLVLRTLQVMLTTEFTGRLLRPTLCNRSAPGFLRLKRHCSESCLIRIPEEYSYDNHEQVTSRLHFRKAWHYPFQNSCAFNTSHFSAHRSKRIEQWCWPVVLCGYEAWSMSDFRLQPSRKYLPSSLMLRSLELQLPTSLKDQVVVILDPWRGDRQVAQKSL